MEYGAKHDCEASEAERLLLQGKPLEKRAYRVSRAVVLSVPKVLPRKTPIAIAAQRAQAQKEQ